MPDLQAILIDIKALIHEGGWVFVSLVVLAFAIAFALISLWTAMRLPDAPFISSRDWLSLLKQTSESEALKKKLNDRLPANADRSRQLQEIAQRLFSKQERRFPFAFILISSAPLIGLLGTVSGMFTTFHGMSSSSAGAPIDVISRGISEALITTQTGLVIGVPTYIVCAWLKSRYDELVLHFSQLESQLLQDQST
ncbi:MotA/TolQ/ExbB proton channel family protein [Verrucomicrobiales bacterium BCK34]|nr:MotA/TolQ/ExbB proton channel family protein [Verrucomicrobiales bacterium BCK34]